MSHGSYCDMAIVVEGSFEWDSEKAAANVEKHDITFEEASSVFADENALESGDALEPANLITIGFSARARVLLVVSTERGERIRIISARKATKHEQEIYSRG